MSSFYLLIILLSTAGISALVYAKIVEIRTKKQGTLSRLSTAWDPTLRKKVERLADISSRITTVNIRKVAVWLGGWIFHLFGTAGLFVSKLYARMTKSVRGVRSLDKKKGAVSFFLRDVAESRVKRAEKNRE
ncbi:MAG: hypothetical protein NUV54_01700 [Candidatus Taylorbacteria bacterium]|nr:hypothetical protein [Candidatus Taylorbacteria bacterium]